jgi:phenylalanyl-tRNA synthetase beta chain
MKISRNWLSDFITWKENDPLKIADALTKGTGEVDDTELQGRFLQHCVVGKVMKIAKHPNADKLSLVDVQTDKGTKRVVCGGTNLYEGMLVAFAHSGATVKWHGGEVMELQPVKIRGEASEGMICAAEELELPFAPKPEDGERPIVDLSSMDLKVGTSLKQALNMDDVVFHIDNHAITNRPDLFSHVGVARECVALGLATWKKEKSAKRPTFPKNALPFKITSRIPKLIPRYLACTISFDDMSETPAWMRERLAACGCRSINLPIDITNYVQYEQGMPLHSFDPADFQGNITMRIAEEGEKIITLDGVERVLPEGAVVISDDEGIFDLLGIMGGLRSGTKDSTRTVFLHSAVVHGASIRKAIIATGHRTDAATVYEKDIAPVTCEQGFYRALDLFLTLLPGATITSKLETWGTNGKPKTITVEQSFIDRMIGQEIPSKKIIQILKDVGCAVTGTKKLSIKPPLWRQHDLTQPADIVEEIARMVGYNAIKADMPAARLEPPVRDPRIADVRSALKEDGWIEFVNLAFSSPELLTKAGFDPASCIAIQNPLGEELSLMHPSLLPSLLDVLSRELPAASNALRGFEMGNVFEAGSPERLELTLVLASKNEPGLIDHPFLLLKQDLIRALSAASHHAELQQLKKGDAQLHPGQRADVLVQGTKVGTIGTLHPSIQAAFGFTYPIAVATLNVDLLLQREPTTKVTKTVPPFPAISYDETVALTKKSAMKELLKKLRGVDALLEDIQTVDLYKKGNDERITLRFTYRAPDRTLTESDVSPVHGKIVALLKNA